MLYHAPVLKEASKELLGFVVRFAGAEILIRAVCSWRRATIVVYHDPSPDVFARHMAYLSRRYAFIPLETLVRAIETQDWSDVPLRALVVTLDDGHKGNRALVDVCKAHGITPTIYLCSQIADTHRHFWWKTTWSKETRFAEMPHVQFLNLLRDKADYWPEKAYPDRQALDRTELLEMRAHVTFGSHTRFHPVLTQCDDATLTTEVTQSKAELERLLGVPVEHFAYPNGNYSSRETDCVRRAGYRSARSLRVGWNALNTDRYALKVTGVQDDASLNVLSGQITGVFGLLRLLTDKMKRVWPRARAAKRRPGP